MKIMNNYETFQHTECVGITMAEGSRCTVETLCGLKKLPTQSQHSVGQTAETFFPLVLKGDMLKE
jgi:hypothetical protein